MARRAKNPWAICRAAANRSRKKWSKKKIERCVLKVKRKRK